MSFYASFILIETLRFKQFEQDPKQFGKSLAEDAAKIIRKTLSPRN